MNSFHLERESMTIKDANTMRLSLGWLIKEWTLIDFQLSICIFRESFSRREETLGSVKFFAHEQ